MRKTLALAAATLLWVARPLADAPSGTGVYSEAPMRMTAILADQMEVNGSFVDKLISAMAQSYDLSLKVKQANKLTDDDDYLEWLKKKSVSEAPHQKRAASLMAEDWRMQ